MRAICLVIVMFSGLVHAQDEPRAMLRTRLEPRGPVMVGQPVRLHVDVLVTTWLTRAPIFPAFEMEGAMVVLPDERSTNLNERIEGQTWFGVTRSYLIFPQEPREYVSPAIEMAVFPGQSEGPVTLQFQQRSFQAQIPAEAQGLGYFIATRNLEIKQELDRDLKDLKAGDSIQRTIRMFADQTFSMFLPPVEFEEIEGLSVYSDPPQIEDRSEDRIGFQGGERIESATYLIQEEGEYELSPFAIYWWDLGSGRMREAGVPAIKFSAAPNPDYIPEIPLPQEEVVEEAVPEKKNWLDMAKQWAGPMALGVLLLVVGISVLRRLIKNIRKRIAERRNAYQESEAAAFDQIRTAVQSGDTEGFIQYLYQWSDRILPGDQISTFRHLSGKDRQLDEQLETLLGNRYSNSTIDKGWSKGTLIKGLAKVRKEFKRASHDRIESQYRLPSLNP